MQNQNVSCRWDLERQVIIYRALRDIREGEKLCISYGGHLTFVDADEADSTVHTVQNEHELMGKIQLDT